MARTIELTLEQEFSLRNFADQVQRMSRDTSSRVLARAIQAHDDSGNDVSRTPEKGLEARSRF